MKYFALVVFYFSAFIFTSHLWDLAGLSLFYNTVGRLGTWAFITLWFLVVSDKLAEEDGGKG